MVVVMVEMVVMVVAVMEGLTFGFSHRSTYIVDPVFVSNLAHSWHDLQALSDLNYLTLFSVTQVVMPGRTLEALLCIIQRQCTTLLPDASGGFITFLPTLFLSRKLVHIPVIGTCMPTGLCAVYCTSETLFQLAGSFFSNRRRLQSAFRFTGHNASL